MRIALIQADIDAGIRGSCFACPWSLAILRAMPRRDLLCGAVAITDGMGDVLLRLPKDIRDWITAYDYFGRTLGWEALSFELPDDLGKHG